MNVLLSYVILIVIIYILAILFRDRLKIDIYGPILMRRTQKMRGWIDFIAKLSPRFWRWSMNIGIPIAILGMIFMAVSYTHLYAQKTLLKSQFSPLHYLDSSCNSPFVNVKKYMFLFYSEYTLFIYLTENLNKYYWRDLKTILLDNQLM